MLPAMLSLLISAVLFITVCELVLAQESFTTVRATVNTTAYLLPIITPVKTFSKSVTIGLVVTSSSVLSGQPATRAMYAVIRKVNNSTGILPTTGITFIVNDTLGDQGRTIACLLYQQQNAGISAILGEGDTLTARAGSYVAKLFNIPQMSWGATDSVFDSYPWFFRTINSIVPQGVVLVRAIRTIGWTRIAFICGAGTLSISAAGAIQDEANCVSTNAQGVKVAIAGCTIVDVVATQVFQSGQTDPLFQLQALINARAHIIGLIGVAGEMVPLLRAIHANKLYGPGFQYFCLWTLLDASTWTPASGFDNSIYLPMQNMLGVLPYTDPLSNEYKEFSRIYQAEPTDVWMFRSQPVGSLPTLRAALAHDAAYAVAYALDSVIEKQRHTLPLNSSAYAPGTGPLMAAMKAVNFEGATGRVLFDSGGNRVSRFSIVQMQETNFAVVATTQFVLPLGSDPTYKFTVKFVAPASDPTLGIRFIGGVMYIDDDARVEQTVGTAMVAVAIVIALVGIAMNIVVLVVFRKSLDKPIVRAASIPFSIMLNVGCMIGWLSLITTAMDKGSIGAAAWQFSCQAQIWLLSLSWALIFLALLAKTWRYGRIYSIPGLNTVKLSDEQLLKVTGILMSFEFLINLVWAVYDPLQPVFVKIQPVVFSPKCTAATAWSFATAALVYKGLIGVYCLVCALQIRAYNEGKSIIAAVAIMLLLAAVVFPYSQSLEDLIISHVVIAIGIIAGMLAVINISFGNLVATYFFEPHVLDVIPNEEVALSAASS